jgi:hypothetical protein
MLMVSNLHFVSSAVAQSPLGGYLYSPAPVKQMPTRQVSIPPTFFLDLTETAALQSYNSNIFVSFPQICRDGGGKIQRW